MKPVKINESRIDGIPASPGIAIGKVRRLNRSLVISAAGAENSAEELARFEEALVRAKQSIVLLQQNAAGKLSKDELEIFDFHLQLMEDDEWLGNIKDRISRGENAMYSVDQVSKEIAEEFKTMDNEYMNERAADLLDVGRRMIGELSGAGEAESAANDEAVILIADELTPSEVTALGIGRIGGLITERGGANSHFAILARAFSIPAVVGTGALAADLIDTGDSIILDGSNGIIIARPSGETAAEYEEKQRKEADQRQTWEEFRHKDAETRDGTRVFVEINMESIDDADVMKESGIDGVGLFRTEFLFMKGSKFPDEETQYAVYRQILELAAPRPVTIRTMDIGGDKPLSYFPLEEDNPFLGYRGIRISLKEEEIFQTQLRALYRASEHGNLKIMFPMIQGVDDFERAKQISEKVRNETGCAAVPIGCMIEVPSAVWMIDFLVREADFISLGTNDLTQYILAADRMNEQVSEWYQPLHPAVLRAVAVTAQAAAREGKPVSVCGEMAGDPKAIPLLIGMGVHSLSMSGGRVPRAKHAISKVASGQAKQLVEQVVHEAKTTKAVMDIIARYEGMEN